jgi:hypothetical protein
MAEFNITNLIDRPLTAKVATKLYRTANDAAKNYASVAAGQPLGTLYSWISPNANTKSLWFMFYDSNNKPYYVKYSANLISSDALIKAGVKDVEKAAKEAKDKQDFEDKGAIRFYLEKYAPYIIGAIFLIPIAKKLIDKKL